MAAPSGLVRKMSAERYRSIFYVERLARGITARTIITLDVHHASCDDGADDRIFQMPEYQIHFVCNLLLIDKVSVGKRRYQKIDRLREKVAHGAHPESFSPWRENHGGSFVLPDLQAAHGGNDSGIVHWFVSITHTGENMLALRAWILAGWIRIPASILRNF